jgi:hypothetical protein
MNSKHLLIKQNILSLKKLQNKQTVTLYFFDLKRIQFLKHSRKKSGDF